jgi:glycosyltransferase involved in cell wall biosynthesis
MKRILLISYYYPPSNNIGALRVQSFAENFARMGLEVTVVTRHWTGKEQTWEDYHRGSEELLEISETDGVRVVRLPSAPVVRQPSSRSVIRRARLLKEIVQGKLQSESNAAAAFRPFLDEYLKSEAFDIVLVSSPPQNIIELGSHISGRFRIPLVVDMRDLWSVTDLATSRNAEPLRQRILNRIQKHYMKRWLSAAELVCGVSEPITEQIKRVVPSRRVITITNGFERDLFNGRRRIPNSKFTVSCVGTLYPRQDLSIMGEGVDLFMKDKSADEVEFNFVGAAVRDDVDKLIREQFPAESTNITERLPREAAVRYMADADVLFYPGWKGYRGIFSGKIFEYLASGNNILIAPSDRDVIENVVVDTATGKVAESPDEVAQALNQWFSEWKQFGRPHYSGKTELIDSFSRENQAALLSEEILRIPG